MYHSQQHRMQNCQFLYLRESFGYNRELFVCPSCVHRVAIGRLRVCVGSILAFYQIRDENRAKLKISYSCGHRVSKSARYDATLNNYIAKTCLCNEYPLKPHFYIEKLGYAGIYFFSYFAPKHRLWVLVRSALARRF